MSRGFRVLCAVLLVPGALACTFARRNVVPFKDPSTGMEMVPVKGGCYPMGSASEVGGPEERPSHEVCVDDFFMGRTEVTQGQWKRVMGTNPSPNSGCGDDCPVDNVSWADAQAFIGRLNAKGVGDGLSSGLYRLPTEAEWEFAARSGGKDEKFPGRNDDPDAVAWGYFSGEETHPRAVGLKAPNGLGLYDMAGNVWEWTNDWYGATYYAASPRKNPSGPASGDRRVLRGGGFGDAAFEVRTTYRNYLPADYRGSGKGLRLVRAEPIRVDPVVATQVGAQASPTPPQRVKDPTTGMEMVLVKGGCYPMGNTQGDAREWAEAGESLETPVHEVCVGDFYMAIHEATQGEWNAVMGGPPKREGGCDGRHLCRASDCPMGNVSWADVQAFIGRLNDKSGGGKYRLPTEAEWEYAARSGGKSERYSGGNDVESVSWHDNNSGYRAEFLQDPLFPLSHPVGAKAPNGLGIFDMSGNLYELTSDWFENASYSSSPRTNPTGPATGTEHVIRGGCAHGGPPNSRVTRRKTFVDPCDLIGFRLVRTP